MLRSDRPPPAWSMDIQVIHSFQDRIVLSGGFWQLSTDWSWWHTHAIFESMPFSEDWWAACNQA